MSKEKKLAFKLFSIAVFLYEIYGGAHLYYNQALSLFFLSYFIVGVIAFVGSYYILRYFNISAMVFYSISLVLANTFVVNVMNTYDDTNLLFFMALMFGIMEFSWLLPRRHSYFMYLICLLFSLGSFYFLRLHTHLSILTIVPFILFFAWNIITSFFQHNFFEDHLELHKLNTFKATIVTLKHEFNNISFVILGILSRMKKVEKRDDQLEEKLESSLKSFVRVIKNFESTNEYQEEYYSDEVKMAVIKKENH